MDLNNPVFQAAPILGAQTEETDLEKRLGLYQVFCKLYEQNSELLDEILDLENIDGNSGRSIPFYIVGKVQQGQPCLLTNLLKGRSQNLHQPDGCWLIGRSPEAALSFSDPRLSRYHAVIQYIQGEGFYFVDLKSTNGSFVNGEVVSYRHRLKEGDRLRMGSLVIQFYDSPESQRLPALPREVRNYLGLQPTAAGSAASEQQSQDTQGSRPEDTQTFMSAEAESEESARITTHQARALDWMKVD